MSLDVAVHLPEAQREAEPVPPDVEPVHTEDDRIDGVDVGGQHWRRSMPHCRHAPPGARPHRRRACADVRDGGRLAAGPRSHPQRRLRGPAAAETWPAGGPRVVWRKAVGQGLSGPVVADGRVILFHRVENREVVEAIDPRPGRRSGSTPIPRPIATTSASTRARARCRWSPTASSTRSAPKGSSTPWISPTGTRVWSEDTMKRFSVAKGYFGAAGSPLVEDGRVIANIGGDKARHRRVRREDRQGAVDGHRRRARATRPGSAPRSAASGSRCS